MITRLTPGVLLPPDHRHELKFLIPITLIDMTTITVIDHGMSLSVLYLKDIRIHIPATSLTEQGKLISLKDYLYYMGALNRIVYQGSMVLW